MAGRHAEALVTLQAAQQLGRDSAELHNGLGAIWFAQKKWRLGMTGEGERMTPFYDSD